MLQSDTWSLSEKTEDEINSLLSLIDNSQLSDLNINDFNFTMFQKLAIGLAAPVLLPIAIGNIVKSALIFL
jgi:hypothetical protein